MADDNDDGTEQRRDRTNSRDRKKRVSPKLHINYPDPQGDESMVIIQAVLYGPDGPIQDALVSFEVNGVKQVGEYETDRDGVAEYAYELTPGTKELKVKATARKDKILISAENRPDLAQYRRRTQKVRISRESVKISPGRVSYHLAIIDEATNLTMDGKLVVKTNKPVLLNGEEKPLRFIIDVPRTGCDVEIQVLEPGRHELDLIPEAYPECAVEVEIYGPPRKPLQAKPYSPNEVKFFDGCV